jgi:hypothetical protein
MSETTRIDTILAVVVVEEAKAKVAGGSAPVFIVKDKEEQEKIALILSRIIKAMAHDLENGVYILVKH